MADTLPGASHEGCRKALLQIHNLKDSMFTQMAQQLLQRHEPSAELNSIDLDSYLEWQRNHTFEALQNIRYGQSFCNHFDIRDNRIFYERDWVRCDNLIRKEWLSRP